MLNNRCLAATNGAEEDFKLRPPRAEIPPSFWEQNANWVVPMAIAAALAVGLLVWYFLRQKRPSEVPPEVRARRELERLAAEPANRELLSRASQVLKRYLAEVFRLSPGEMTTAEFSAAFAAKPEPGAELVRDVCQFLRRGDEQKFAPQSLPVTNVPEALRLLAQTEARRAELRAAESTAASTPRTAGVGTA